MVQTTKSILIVDDSETNLVLLEIVLKNKGWTIKKANSASLAIKMIKASRPDLVLLDLLMPEIDGYQVLDWLKSDEKFRDIPVIVVSAVNESKTREVCIKKGAVDYMPKPVRIEQLLKKVQNILKVHNAE